MITRIVTVLCVSLLAACVNSPPQQEVPGYVGLERTDTTATLNVDLNSTDDLVFIGVVNGDRTDYFDPRSLGPNAQTDIGDGAALNISQGNVILTTGADRGFVVNAGRFDVLCPPGLIRCLPCDPGASIGAAQLSEIFGDVAGFVFAGCGGGTGPELRRVRYRCQPVTKFFCSTTNKGHDTEAQCESACDGECEAKRTYNCGTN